MVANHIARVRQVEEQQPRDHRVERFGVAELARVRLGEVHVRDATRATTRLGNREQRRRLVDRHHRSARPDEPRELEGDMTHAGPELEHPHALADPGRTQEQRRPGPECLGLTI